MSSLLDMNSLAPWLPLFEEATQDIPVGYGIEQSGDGGWYPYEINIADIDLCCESRHQALSAILAEVEG